MKEFKRILIVDDNKDIHEDFHKILKSGIEYDSNLSELEAALFDEEAVEEDTESAEAFSCELDDAYQGDEAIMIVEKAEKEGNPYVVVFMDVRMPPGMNGIETIYRIWRKYPLIEMVICTAYSDYSWDEIVGKLGATDKLLFLKKPFNSVEVKQMALSLLKKWNLNHQVNRLVNNLEEEVKERTKQLDSLLLELREKNKKLAEIAQRDSLTGLLNHAALYEELSAAFSESRRHEFPLIVIMLDIDHFKKINDTYGHMVGDDIIKKVSEGLQVTLRLYDITLRYKDNEIDTLKEEIKRYDVAGRYGGDEFILIIPHCGEDGAISVAERIHINIRDIRLKRYPEIRITASIGVAILEKDVRCNDSTELVKLADKALYSSKSKGRDQISYLKYETQEDE